MADDDIDEVALNTLLAEGIDAPTAMAGSYRDKGPRQSNAVWVIFIAVVTAAIVFWMCA